MKHECPICHGCGKMDASHYCINCDGEGLISDEYTEYEDWKEKEESK